MILSFCRCNYNYNKYCTTFEIENFKPELYIMKKYFTITIAVLIGLIAGFIIQPLISEDTVFNQVRKFDFVLNTAIKNYVDEVDT